VGQGEAAAAGIDAATLGAAPGLGDPRVAARAGGRPRAQAIAPGGRARRNRHVVEVDGGPCVVDGATRLQRVGAELDPSLEGQVLQHEVSAGADLEEARVAPLRIQGGTEPVDRQVTGKDRGQGVVAVGGIVRLGEEIVPARGELDGIDRRVGVGELDGGDQRRHVAVGDGNGGRHGAGFQLPYPQAPPAGTVAGRALVAAPAAECVQPAANCVCCHGCFLPSGLRLLPTEPVG
jgi:hypothetical protein